MFVGVLCLFANERILSILGRGGACSSRYKRLDITKGKHCKTKELPLSQTKSAPSFREEQAPPLPVCGYNFVPAQP